MKRKESEVKAEEKKELKEFNQFMTGKVENQNHTHNARKEGTFKITKLF